MEPNDYVVDRIEGDYAYLRLRDGSSDEELFIAMALLPDGTVPGSLLHCDFPDFTLI